MRRKGALNPQQAGNCTSVYFTRGLGTGEVCFELRRAPHFLHSSCKSPSATAATLLLEPRGENYPLLGTAADCRTFTITAEVRDVAAAKASSGVRRRDAVGGVPSPSLPRLRLLGNNLAAVSVWLGGDNRSKSPPSARGIRCWDTERGGVEVKVLEVCPL